MDMIFTGKERDLGGFSVYRILPNIKKRSVGPFVFFDHLGPMTIDESHVLDVRPHPHIGLSTVTYLFQGKGFHRDSLGNTQLIEPGDVNLMTAGAGIVHSERTPEDERIADGLHGVHGLQFWLALPKEQEDCAPSFIHYSKKALPDIAFSKGVRGKLLMGDYEQSSSPVTHHWPTFFMVLEADEDDHVELPLVSGEYGLFVASGSVTVDENNLVGENLLVTTGPRKLKIKMTAKSKIAIFGGDPLPEKRLIWWNFVSTSSEKIQKAALQWKNQTMGKVIGETEFIPLPNDPLPK